jgi:very-short-patch-repair endonuclease
MYICKICNKEYSNLLGLSSHLKQKHNYNILQYYIDYEKFEIPKCDCGEKLKYVAGLNFRSTCGNKKCLKKLQKNRIQSNETRLKISNKMIQLSKDGVLKGWSINNDINRRSYPEKFFIKLLEMNDLYSKYTIKEKLSFGKYFLDFAFLEIKTDVEIDGQQHFISEKAINHDLKRDQYLLENGWNVYRIAWLELKNNPKKIIKDFLVWLSETKSYRKYDINEILSKLNNHKSKKTKFDIEKKKQLILDCNINFSEMGWIKKSTEQLGFNPFIFIRKYMPDLYEKCNKKHKKSKINKHKNRKKYFEDRKNEYFEKNKPIIEEILKSDINFSRKGWVKQVSKIINISENKGGQWVKKNMPDFYKTCWKRCSHNLIE